MKPVTSALVALALVSPYAVADDDMEFDARLTGDQEVPPIETATRGSASFEVDEEFSSIDFKLKVRSRGGVGLLGVAGAHIHCAPAGQNGPVVAFLAGVVPGGLDGKVRIRATLTDANIVDAACGANVAELASAMVNGMTYVNVHSLMNPSGEVRGQIVVDD